MSECAPAHVFESEVKTHPSVRAWSQLNAAHAEPSHITTLKSQEGKSAVHRLEGVGRDGGAVIAKYCRQAVVAAERAVYEQVLPQLPLPSLHFYGSLGDADEFGWLFVEDAGDQRMGTSDEEHRCLASRWLAQLHTSASKLEKQAKLPDRSPDFYRTQAGAVRQAIAHSAGNPALYPDDRAVLSAVDRQLAFIDARWDQVEAACAGIPRTLVHGDFVRKNVRLRHTPHGTELLALDWETAGWGVPAIDLCRFVGGPVKPDLASYCAAMREAGEPVTLEQVEALAHVGSVFRLISAMYWAALRLDQPWVAKCMVWMGCYRTYMVDALRATHWGQGIED